MTLKQLEYFLTVCKYNNITQAADELHISQPSLSYAVRELEEEFGLPLFRRLSKGLSLTEAGQVLREEASALTEQSRRLTARMNALAGEPQTLRFGVPPMLSALLFPRLLQTFHGKYPHIQLLVAENGTLTNKKLLLDGGLDAAMISTDSPLPSAFGSHLLCRLNIRLYISAHHPLAARSRTELSDLYDLPLLFLAQDAFLTDYMKRQFEAHHRQPNVVLHTNQLNTICQLIEDGVAAAFLYDHLMDSSQAFPAIVSLPVDGLSQIQVRLAWDAAKPPSKALRGLIAAARETAFFGPA